LKRRLKKEVDEMRDNESSRLAGMTSIGIQKRAKPDIVADRLVYDGMGANQEVETKAWDVTLTNKRTDSPISKRYSPTSKVSRLCGPPLHRDRGAIDYAHRVRIPEFASPHQLRSSVARPD